MTYTVYCFMAFLFALVSILLGFNGWASEHAFLVFAALMLVWSLVHPHVVDKLDKTVVDPWYYALGLVAVIAIYISEADPRRVLRKQMEYSVVLSKHSRIEAKKHGLKEVRSNPKEAFETLKAELPSLIAAAIRDHRQAANLSTHSDETATPHQQELFKTFQRQRIKELETWSAFVSQMMFSEIDSYDLDTLPSLKSGVSWEGFLFPADDLLWAVKMAATDIGTLDEEIDRITAEATTVASTADTTKEELDQKISDRQPQNLTLQIIMSYAWPYLGVFLLGMKLTRQRIGGKDRQESTIEILRSIDAPTNEVWTAFTDKEYVVKWWGPHGYVTEVVEHEFKSSGRWIYVMESPDGSRYPSDGLIHDIEQEKYFRVTARFGGEFTHADVAELADRVDLFVRLSDVVETTQLTLQITFRSVDARKKYEDLGIENIWQHRCDRLQQVLTSPAPEGEA